MILLLLFLFLPARQGSPVKTEHPSCTRPLLQGKAAQRGRGLQACF